MKVCLQCGSAFAHSSWSCPACGFSPVQTGRCVSLIPGGLAKPSGYDVSFFPQLAELEEHNFWFRARTALITWALGSYFPAASKFLEVGCGTGTVLHGVSRAFPAMELFASEPFVEGLAFAQQRVRHATYLQMDGRAIPFAEEFDVIGAFDVLEHIDEDEAVLAQMHRAARKGGGLLLAVPQHQFLWSPQDDAAGHVRRYNASDMRVKLERAGFTVRRMTSFVALLLPLMLASRRGKRKHGARCDPLDELRLNRPLNAVLSAVMTLERGLIRGGLSLPAGGSLLAVAEKR